MQRFKKNKTSGTKYTDQSSSKYNIRGIFYKSNPKTAGRFLTLKLFRKRVKPRILVVYNIIITYIFPENFIEITQIVQKIWIFSSSILTIFNNFLDFLTYPCYE